MLDTLMNPFRHSYQSLRYGRATLAAKGAYSIFDNVTAIFAANRWNSASSLTRFIL